MRRLHPVLPLLLGVALVVLVSRPAPAIDESASRPVAELEIALKGMLQKGPEASFATRYRDIFRTVAATHDFDYLARQRVGPRWDGLSADDQKALKDLLFKRVVAEYATRLEGVDPLNLVRGRVTDAGAGTGLVGLNVGGRPVLVFRVGSKAEVWTITDVLWDGRESASADRAESERILATGTVADLRAAWTRKIPIPDTGPSSASEAKVPEGPPLAVVEYLQDEIVAIMKQAAELGYRGRLEKFRPLIDQTHHLPAIARLVIQRAWGQLSVDQRRAFVERFREFSVARYASRFDGYSGERFETGREQDQGSAKVVSSDLVKADGKRIRFQWVLREVSGRWQILNIIVDGVSDLATKQAEYNQIFQQQGFAGLLRKVEEQTRIQEKGG